MLNMAIQVVNGFQIRKIFPKNQHTQKKLLNFGLMASCQKVPNFDFQSQFSMSNIIQNFLIYFSLKNTNLRAYIFVPPVWKIHNPYCHDDNDDGRLSGKFMEENPIPSQLETPDRPLIFPRLFPLEKSPCQE